MRIFLFIAFIVLLVAGWFGGWFFVAGQVDGVISDVKRKLADNQQSLDCTNQEISGFPFRISLNCDTLVYANPANGVTLTTGPLRSAAQAYQPNKAVAEVTGPARLTLPLNETYETRWSSMRTSMTAGLSGPNRFSLSGENVLIEPEQTNRPALRIEGLEVHSRRSGEDAVDLALKINEATTETKPWPDYSLLLDIRLDEIYADLIRQTDLLEIARKKGLRGELHRLQYTALQGGSAIVEGPVSIDKQGRVSGKFQITVSELPKLLAALAKAFPEKQNDIQKASDVLEAVAGSGKDAEFSVPITVKNGTAIFGLFPIGEIPPIY